MMWLQENSAAIQAIATVVLVVVTVLYVVFTRSLADEAKEQAEAAQKQAEAAQKQADAAREQAAAAKESLGRAYDDGIRQQVQLVQRQAVLQARSELVSLLANAIEWLVAALELSVQLKHRDTNVSDATWAAVARDAVARVPATPGSGTLDYLQDYAGAFPISHQLASDLRIEALLASTQLDVAKAWVERAQYESVSLEPMKEAASKLWETAFPLLHIVRELRSAVSSTGYQRAFGSVSLDSPDLGVETKHLGVVAGEWVEMRDESYGSSPGQASAG